MPIIESATNRWTLYPQGHMTLGVSEAEIVLKGGLFGRLLEPIMRGQMKALGPRSLASLKYLVENGKPYPDIHSELALAPVNC